jgi:hypothetical protein
MSEIRRQLEAARNEHRATRYPGNLAADVLKAEYGRGRMRIAMWIGGAAGAAIAAGIALVVMTHRTAAPPAQPGGNPALVEIASSALDMPPKPEMPPAQLITDLRERPTMPSFFAITATAADQEEHL